MGSKGALPEHLIQGAGLPLARWPFPLSALHTALSQCSKFRLSQHNAMIEIGLLCDSLFFKNFLANFSFSFSSLSAFLSCKDTEDVMKARDPIIELCNPLNVRKGEG